MSFACPVCNGLQSLFAACPRCSRLMEDQGKYNDYLGPYSPYRSIDDISMTNGFPDLQRHDCMHLVYCPDCRRTFTIAVHEWRE